MIAISEADTLDLCYSYANGNRLSGGDLLRMYYPIMATISKKLARRAKILQESDFVQIGGLEILSAVPRILKNDRDGIVEYVVGCARSGMWRALLCDDDLITIGKKERAAIAKAIKGNSVSEKQRILLQLKSVVSLDSADDIGDEEDSSISLVSRLSYNGGTPEDILIYVEDMMGRGYCDMRMISPRCAPTAKESVFR